MKRKIFIFIALSSFFIILLLSISSFLVYYYHNGKYDKNQVYDYGIVFGAAIRAKGKLSPTLESRMLTAIKLYQEGSISKIVLSGAVYKTSGEPQEMYQFAVQRGVSPKDLILDKNGTNTMQTLLYAKQLTQKNKSVLFISSYFHLARIHLTANLLGIDYFGIYPSETNHPTNTYFVFRESLAIWYYLFYAFIA